jgi:hypothetical protein
LREGGAFFLAAHSNVRFGSKADMAANLPNVRFTPKSGHSRPITQFADADISR